MATGDQNDFTGRLRAVLPTRWFSPQPMAQSPTPISLLPEQSGYVKSPLLTGSRSPLLTSAGTPLVINATGAAPGALRLLTNAGTPLVVGYAAASRPASPTPILDAVLTGLASVWSSLYALLAYVQAQTRIATAYGAFLDFISADYFGTGLPRLLNEQDAAFRGRITANLFAAKGTRAAVIANVTALTGRAPNVFEPARPGDTGSYGRAGSFAWGGLAYCDAGGYGDLQLPHQCFIVAHRPLTPGIPSAAGYGTMTGHSVSSPAGGYGNGVTLAATSPNTEYGSISFEAGAWSDSLLYETIAQTMQAGTIAWTQIVP